MLDNFHLKQYKHFSTSNILQGKTYLPFTVPLKSSKSNLNFPDNLLYILMQDIVAMENSWISFVYLHDAFPVYASPVLLGYYKIKQKPKTIRIYSSSSSIKTDSNLTILIREQNLKLLKRMTILFTGKKYKRLIVQLLLDSSSIKFNNFVST